MNETAGLFDGIGKAIAAMPPALAAIVIMGLSIVALVYLFRRAGDEAKREKHRADDAVASGTHAKLTAIHDTVVSVEGKIDDLRLEVARAVGGGRK